MKQQRHRKADLNMHIYLGRTIHSFDNHHSHMTSYGALEDTGVIFACKPSFPHYLQGLKD